MQEAERLARLELRRTTRPRPEASLDCKLLSEFAKGHGQERPGKDPTMESRNLMTRRLCRSSAAGSGTAQ